MSEGREAAMVVVKRDCEGHPTVWCDPEIADVVSALNSGALVTVASCSGHGFRPGVISMEDGRQLMVLADTRQLEIAQQPFAFDINGELVSRFDPEIIEQIAAFLWAEWEGSRLWEKATDNEKRGYIEQAAVVHSMCVGARNPTT